MNSINFQAKGNVNKALKELESKKMPNVDKVIEQSKGFIEGMSPPKAEIKEAIMRETMLVNSDFVKSTNEALSKNAAKDAYKNV